MTEDGLDPQGSRPSFYDEVTEAQRRTESCLGSHSQERIIRHGQGLPSATSINLQRWQGLRGHFTDGETKVRRGQAPCSRSPSQEREG